MKFRRRITTQSSSFVNTRVTTTNTESIKLDNNPSIPIESSSNYPIRRTRSLRDIYDHFSFALNFSDPITYEEDVKRKEWQDAMNEELIAIHRNQTWDLIKTLIDKKVIGLKWI